MFTCVGSLVNLEVLRSSEHLPASGEGAREWFLARMNPDVINKFVFCFERLLFPWTVLPKACVVGLLRSSDMFNSYMGDYLMHGGERFITRFLRLWLFLFYPQTGQFLFDRLAHVPEERSMTVMGDLCSYSCSYSYSCDYGVVGRWGNRYEGRPSGWIGRAACRLAARASSGCSWSRRGSVVREVRGISHELLSCPSGGASRSRGTCCGGWLRSWRSRRARGRTAHPKMGAFRRWRVGPGEARSLVPSWRVDWGNR